MIFYTNNNNNNRLSLILSKSQKVQIITRGYPGGVPAGAMAMGTLITGGFNKVSLKLILSLQNQYLRGCVRGEFDFNRMLDFIEEGMLVHPKYFQHILSATFSELNYPLDVLAQRYPTLGIHEIKSDIAVGSDMLISTVAAAHMLRTGSFNKGKLHVLGTPLKQRFEENKMPYFQTGQPNPDYLYDQLMWSRHYDYKTGLFNVNTGHVKFASNDEMYDSLCQKLLLGQSSVYKTSCMPAYNLLVKLIQDKKLTWGERNELFRQQVDSLMSKYNNLNPSMIIKTPLSYNTLNTKTDKKLDAVVNAIDCLENKHKTDETIAKSILSGGAACKEAFKAHLGASKPIKDVMESMGPITAILD